MNNFSAPIMSREISEPNSIQAYGTPLRFIADADPIALEEPVENNLN